ncbi:hypothetical protein KCU71_g180, partial [Aureobasidium melanogenum]
LFCGPNKKIRLFSRQKVEEVRAEKVLKRRSHEMSGWKETTRAGECAGLTAQPRLCNAKFQYMFCAEVSDRCKTWCGRDRLYVRPPVWSRHQHGFYHYPDDTAVRFVVMLVACLAFWTSPSRLHSGRWKRPCGLHQQNLDPKPYFFDHHCDKEAATVDALCGELQCSPISKTNKSGITKYKYSTFQKQKRQPECMLRVPLESICKDGSKQGASSTTASCETTLFHRELHVTLYMLVTTPGLQILLQTQAGSSAALLSRTPGEVSTGPVRMDCHILYSMPLDSPTHHPISIGPGDVTSLDCSLTGSGWIAQSRSLFLLGLFGSESATRDDIAGFGLAQRLGDVERGVLNKGTFGISGRTRQISVGVVE